MSHFKILLFASALLLTGCGTIPATVTKCRTEKQTVTFYHRFEDSFGSATASGVRARAGVTVAAPRRIPFGTRIRIPSLQKEAFIVQDRGRLVQKKNRIDVFIDAPTRKEVKKKLANQVTCVREVIYE